MTIEEAIARERELAERNRRYCEKYKGLEHVTYYNPNCLKYAEEHEQYAEWLEELSRHRVEELFRKNNGYTKEDIELNRNAAYNMAIDDLSIAFISEIKNDSVIPIFVRECETKFTATEVINIFSRTAKQLKECGSND